jgi:hypothetical protein
LLIVERTRNRFELDLMLQLLVRGKINAVRNADDVAIRLTVNMWNNMATNENLVALMLLSIQFLCRVDSHRMWVAVRSVAFHLFQNCCVSF